MRQIGTREFVQHASKYLKLSEIEGGLVILRHNQPKLYLIPVKSKTIDQFKGILKGLKIKGDINDPILQEYGEW